MHKNMVVRILYAITAFFVASASVLAFSGVGQAQAATVANPWVRTGGTALADEFDTIMGHGGLQPVTNPAAVSSTGSASALLLGTGAGLAIGTKGLQLYSKITTGDWDTYTEGLNCGSDWIGKVGDFVGKAFKVMSFGIGGYSCATAPGVVKTDHLPTVDLNDLAVDKAPVPDLRAPAYRVDYTRTYTMHDGNLTRCPAGDFPVTLHMTGFDATGIFVDITNPNVFPITANTASFAKTCTFDQSIDDFGLWFENSTYAAPSRFRGSHDDIASGQTSSYHLRLINTDSGYPEKFAGKKLLCLGPLRDRRSMSIDACLGSTARGDSVATKGDNPLAQRQIACRVTATDGTHIDASGDKYSDSSGIPLDSAKWGCNDAWQSTITAGKMPARVTATSTFPGAVGDPQVLLNKPVTESAQESVTESPECMNASSNSEGCVQRLYKRVGGQLRSCADEDVWEQCADWLEETKAHPDEDTYECKLGTKVVDLKKCRMYAPTFKYPRADTKLHYATDTDTDTAIETQGATAESPDMQNCWAGMISWNPVDWVLTPIKCAAIWAFVPSNPSTWKDVGHAWDGTPPVVVAKTLSGGIPLPEGGSGCSGPLVDLKSVGGKYLSYSGYPMSACQEPMATMATRFRLLASVLMYATTLWMVVRNITAALNVPPPPAAIQPTSF